MAETFAIQPQSVTMQSAPQVQMGRGGIAGGGGVQSPQILEPTVVHNATMEALFGMGEAILKPIVERQQAQNYLDGAQRVAQGEALGEVIDSEPWYSRIFGDSATVQGAQSVAKIQQVDEHANKMAGMRAELATLSPPEARARISAEQMSFMTGDPTTDTVVLQRLVENSGPLMRQQAKDHVKYVQANMQTEWTGLQRTNAQRLQAAVPAMMDGSLSASDYQQVEDLVLATLMPMDGQEPESYWEGLESATVDAMANDNHHYAKVVFGSGVLADAPAETRLKLEDAREKYERRTLTKVGLLEYSNEIAMLGAANAAGQISPAETAQRVVDINAKVRMQTGMERDLLDRKDLTSMLKSNYGKFYARSEDAAKEAAKKQEKGLEDSHNLQHIAGAWAMGKGSLIVNEGHKKADVDAVAQAHLLEARRAGAEWAPTFVRNFNNGNAYINPYLEAEIKSGLYASKAEGYAGAAFNNTYETFKELASQDGGSAAAMAYAGDDGLRMLKYHKLVTSQVAPEAAYQMSFGQPLDKTQASQPAEVLEAMQKTVASAQPGTVSQWLGDLPLTAQGQSRLATQAQPIYDMYVQQLGYSPEEAAKATIPTLKSTTDVLGGYVIPRKPTDPTFAQLVGSGEDEAGKLFSKLVADEAKKSGLNLPMAGQVDEKADVYGPGGVLANATFLGAAYSLASGNTGKLVDRAARLFVDEPTVTPFVSYATDPKTGERFATYSVHVVHDGKASKIVLDSRRARDMYEKGDTFRATTVRGLINDAANMVQPKQ